MAQDDNNLSIGDFSIQDTMELGVGNTALLEGLYASESASASPEDISPIVKTVEEDFIPEEKTAPKGKQVSHPEAPEEEKRKDIISNFLGSEEVVVPEAGEKNIIKEVQDVPEQETSTVTQYTALANDLFNLGVFSKDEDEEDVEIKSPEEFLERFNAEKKKGAIETIDNFIGQFGEDYKAAFDAIYVKGVNPKDYFSVYNTLVDFAELDISNEDNQVKVMKQALTDQGFDPEDVDAEIERLRNYGDLEVAATRHHKVLVKKDANRLQEMEAKAQEGLQRKAAIKNQYIQNVQSVITDKLKNKEFDGLPLNPKIAAELQDFLLVDKWKTPTGETLTDFDRAILDLKNPEKHATKVKLALLMKILEKDPTLSTIQKTGVTKKTDQLFSEVARQASKQGGNAPTNSQAFNAESWFKK